MTRDIQITRDAGQVVCKTQESSRSVEQSDRLNQNELQCMTGTDWRQRKKHKALRNLQNHQCTFKNTKFIPFEFCLRRTLQNWKHKSCKDSHNIISRNDISRGHVDSNPMTRQIDHMENFLLGQPNYFKSNMLLNTQAHRLVFQSLLSQFSSCTHMFFELSSKSQFVTNASSNPETKMQKLSLRTQFWRVNRWNWE